MDEKALATLAAQLRSPEGPQGKEIAKNMNQSNASLNRWVIQSLSIAPGDHLLEIGMGNGFFCQEILSKNATATYTGCDYSTTMVREAEALNTQWTQAHRASFVRAPAHRLPFPIDSFNKSFAVNTFYFWDHPVTELKEIFRVLKPGGRFVVGMASPDTLRLLPFTRYNFNLYHQDEVTSFFRTSGFSSIALDQQTFEPIVIKELEIPRVCWRIIGYKQF